MFNMIFTFVTTLFSALNYFAKTLENGGKAAEAASSAGVVVAVNFRDSQVAVAEANAAQMKEQAQLGHMRRQKRIDEARKSMELTTIDVEAKPSRRK